MSLTVTVNEKEPGVFVVSPVGSIDSSSYMVLEEKVDMLLGILPKVIIFDMEGVVFMSSAGVRVALKTKKALKQGGCAFILVNLQPQIKRVFDIINALPPQEIFASAEELDSYLAVIQGKQREKK